MLRILKSNNPGIVVVNLIFILLYRVSLFLFPQNFPSLFHHSEPFSAILFGSLHQLGLDTTFILSLFGGALCFLQSLLVNLIVNTHKITSKKNYMGGLLFIIWCSFFNEFLVLSPAQIALTFLLLLLHKIFTIGKQEKLYGDIFDIGFLTAAAIFFYFPSIVFVLLIFIGMYTVRTFSLREFVMVLLGFGAVKLFVFTIYFWNDELPRLLSDLTNIKSRISFHWGILKSTEVAILAWIALLIVWIFLNLPSLLSFSAIQVRKYAGVLVVCFFLVLAATVLHFNFNLSHFILLAAPLSILSCLYFVETKANWMAEFLFIVLILSGFVAQVAVKITS